MAPEQWNVCDAVDNRADIYSMGVILYEAVTSKKPAVSCRAPSEVCPGIPAELDRIILRCLESNPDDRYPSAAKLRDDLLTVIPDLSSQQESSRVTIRKPDISISDKYVYLDTLHESPFGATYLVKNAKNSSLVVIKKLCRNLTGIREAKILSKLRHPNLITVYGAGADAEKGILVTEYAQGGSLADRLVRPYPIDAALKIFRQMASGLGYAHKNGIIHGNLRPSNVLFDSSNTVKLSDFALPEHYFRKRENWYGAPERVKSPASDIYASGVILYQLLTSRLPDVRPGGGLAWISRSSDDRFLILNMISQMLETEPSQRPESFEAILRQLDAARSPSAAAAVTSRVEETVSF
jgi:serine/threonine-protein kinase